MSILVPVKTKTIVDDILKELRVFFPKIHFTITFIQDDNFTRITVLYSDGVSIDRVRNITRQFAHSYSAGNDEIKVLIFIERLMSQGVQDLLLNEIKNVWKIRGSISLDDWFKQTNETVRTHLQSIFKMRDF